MNDMNDMTDVEVIKETGAKETLLATDFTAEEILLLYDECSRLPRAAAAARLWKTVTEMVENTAEYAREQLDADLECTLCHGSGGIPEYPCIRCHGSGIANNN